MMKYLKNHLILFGLSFALLSACLLILAPNVLAQDSQEIAAAQQRFDEAVAAYQAEEYTRALDLFQQAYAHVPDPVFLYNAARVAEKMGTLEEALEFAQRADAEVERPLPAALAEKNTALIKSLDAQIAQAQKLAAQQLAEKQRAETERLEKERLEKKRREDREEHARLERQRLLAANSSSWSWIGYSGLGMGIAGVALIGGASFLGARASSDIDAIQGVANSTDYARRRDRIESTQSTGQILLYSGVGLAAVGSTMLIWELTSTREAPVSVSLVPGPGHAGVALSGAF